MCGSVMGYLTMSLPRIGFFELGIWMGICVSFLLNNSVLYKVLYTFF
jgi:hypothetical protein